MARSARDCELVLRSIAGHDPEDPYSADDPQPAPADPESAKKFRIGFVNLNFEKYGNRSVERAFLRALADLEHAGLTIEETKLPDLPFESVTYVILVCEVATAFEELQRNGEARQLVSPEAPLSFLVARAASGADLVKAQRIRTICQREMAAFFGRYDVLLFPGEMHTAFPADKDFSEVPSTDPVGAAGNLCGLPAMSVPCGFGDDGLPVSLAAMTGAFEEAKGVSLARFFQGITSWHTKRPPIGRPSAA